MEVKPDEWGTFAYGLLASIAAICVSYVILRAWPRQHYPRFFAAMAGSRPFAPALLAGDSTARHGSLALCLRKAMPIQLDASAAFLHSGSAVMPASVPAKPFAHWTIGVRTEHW